MPTHISIVPRSRLRATDTTVTGCAFSGLAAFNGGRAAVARCDLSGNTFNGLGAGGAGTHVDAAGTRMVGNGYTGAGVHNGATARLSADCELDDNSVRLA